MKHHFTISQIEEMKKRVPPCVLEEATCDACKWWHSKERKDFFTDPMNLHLLDAALAQMQVDKKELG